MNKMISVASGFQYSVNIGYDLSSNEKLKNFIPTKSSLGLLEEILLSTAETSTERSRVLIGAYGKGKSHIVLTILSILMKRDLRLFEKLLPKLEEHPKLKQCVLNYYESPNKILPVVITGILLRKGGYESEAERADTERRNLTLLDDKNKKIEIYKAYAERIYQELLEVYATSEAEIRSKLETTINEIFKQIYEGGLYLTIDEKYHISVYANDYDGDVETSTAQSISVIFAFITGIIKMARDNRNASDDDAKLLSSEPYPLVMDAPLSAFDKRRIKTVCEALPNTAEQVIIFIKDTDGELAEEYMGDKIGCRHYFDKKNEFETVLV